MHVQVHLRRHGVAPPASMAHRGAATARGACFLGARRVRRARPTRRRATGSSSPRQVRTPASSRSPDGRSRHAAVVNKYEARRVLARRAAARRPQIPSSLIARPMSSTTIIEESETTVSPEKSAF